MCASVALASLRRQVMNSQVNVSGERAVKVSRWRSHDVSFDVHVWHVAQVVKEPIAALLCVM